MADLSGVLLGSGVFLFLIGLVVAVMPIFITIDLWRIGTAMRETRRMHMEIAARFLTKWEEKAEGRAARGNLPLFPCVPVK